MLKKKLFTVFVSIQLFFYLFFYVSRSRLMYVVSYPISASMINNDLLKKCRKKCQLEFKHTHTHTKKLTKEKNLCASLTVS